MGAIAKMFSGKAARQSAQASADAAATRKVETASATASQREAIQNSQTEVDRGLAQARNRPRGRRLLLGDASAPLG
jgi:hypothetical protein